MGKNFKKTFLLNLGASIGVVLFLLVINFVVASDVSSRVKEIENLKQEMAFRAQAIDSLLVLKDESRRAGQYYNTLFEILPTRDELINFRRDLVALAGEHNINLGFVFGSDSPAKGDKPGFAEFQATASGEEKDFLPFLRSMETGLYFIELDSIDLNVNGERFNSPFRGRVFSR